MIEEQEVVGLEVDRLGLPVRAGGCLRARMTPAVSGPRPGVLVLTVETDEPPHRVELLHRNILQFGKITNTLSASCDLSGEIRTTPPRDREQS